MPAAENTSMKRSTSALLVGNAKAPAGSSYQFKTKVVCTLGPSCREKDILKGMLRTCQRRAASLKLRLRDSMAPACTRASAAALW